ncbi:MAG TPA: energy transducer TonB, partial [Thermoanaerobaculia bacterium]|nr:energy transducer TonB [Thermoanaerobaculia bacterium]
EDAWRSPLRIIIDGESYRIISAGSDRKFDPNTWEKPIALDTAEDVIFENGKFTRYLDLSEYMREKVPTTVAPIAQPADARREPTNGWYVVGGGVTAPVVTKRVEPHYPEDARKLRIAGIVILQVAVDAKGGIEDVRVLKSLAPDIDAAALEAVRQWQFQPATLDQNAVPVLFNVTINFRLK